MSDAHATANLPYSSKLIDRIERHLHTRLNEADLPPSLVDAVNYALSPGGKRIRPILVLLSCRAAGGEYESALDAAASVELIHNFSLVHDDLPAMDDDDMRRGKPTLHRHAGEAMAILAGDAMMSIAFELLAAMPVSQQQTNRLIRELAQATTRMIAGQVMDTLGNDRDGSREGERDRRARLESIHSGKTGALIRASSRMGAICAAANDRTLEALDRYGKCVGLMFQVVDDLIDVTQSPQHTGKATGKDEPRGKLTYPRVVGVEESQRLVIGLRDDALRAIEELGEQSEPLSRLVMYLAERTR